MYVCIYIYIYMYVGEHVPLAAPRQTGAPEPWERPAAYFAGVLISLRSQPPRAHDKHIYIYIHTYTHTYIHIYNTII